MNNISIQVTEILRIKLINLLLMYQVTSDSKNRSFSEIVRQCLTIGLEILEARNGIILRKDEVLIPGKIPDWSIDIKTAGRISIYLQNGGNSGSLTMLLINWAEQNAKSAHLYPEMIALCKLAKVKVRGKA